MRFILIVTLLLPFVLGSCHRKIDQRDMFDNRGHKTRKKGIYDAGLNSKKAVSIEIQEEYDKLNKHHTNPQKAARKAIEENKKKQLKSQRKRDRHNRRVRVKVKTTKTKGEGEL